jgi:ribosomal protein S18 acetylase RimI-like enzyme
MKKKEFEGTVEFAMTSGTVPWQDPSEFVHTIEGTAIAFTDVDDEEEAGQITLRLVSVTEAVNRGEDLFIVCDADSAILEAAYWALFDKTGETKEDLDIEIGWNNLLYIEAVECEPEYQDTTLAVRLIETAIAIFCSNGLVISVEKAFDLTIEEWRELGFKRIAESAFVFRDQLRVNPYDGETAG